MWSVGIDIEEDHMPPIFRIKLGIILSSETSMLTYKTPKRLRILITSAEDGTRVPINHYLFVYPNNGSRSFSSISCRSN